MWIIASITDYYSKIKRCNDIVNLCEDHPKEVFIKGLTSKNRTTFALIFGHNLPINELAELLIRMEKETVTDLLPNIVIILESVCAQSFISAFF